jgi:uncharacterized protein
MTLPELIKERISRREALGRISLAAASAVVLTSCGSRPSALDEAGQSFGPDLGFDPVSHQMDDRLHVPPGYTAKVFMRWGDPVLPGAPAFDPHQQTSKSQAGQFGFNNDFIAFMPLPRGTRSSSHGLLCVNHEYIDPKLAFPPGSELTADRVMTELRAVGHTVLEVRKERGEWRVVQESPYARRLNAVDTVTRVSGPAAGHARLKTPDDSTGRRVVGTYANCAGGQTPWGTVLVAEENFHYAFSGTGEGTPEARNHARMSLKRREPTRWSRHDRRFDVCQRPTEPNRYGWIVEYDPYDPASVPVKRTALGRFKHECATTVVSADGRLAVYSGDDKAFEYLYRFVSRDRVNRENPDANRDLLDHGVLSAAYLDVDGTLEWRSLIFGEGPLTPENGFHSQADVLIECRMAADLVGATKMDRPEDVGVCPLTGRVYVMLTQNKDRTSQQLDAGHTRAHNLGGHILEILPPETANGADHTASHGRWEVLLLGGDPSVAEHGAQYGSSATAKDWLVNPDNCEFDRFGRLWVGTDMAPRTTGTADGLFACPIRGPDRARPRRFVALPRGAELCGPCFTPDCKTLFFSVQHPGEGSSFDAPSTRWPDFKANWPARSAVVVVTKDDGGVIGGV